MTGEIPLQILESRAAQFWLAPKRCTNDTPQKLTASKMTTLVIRIYGKNGPPIEATAGVLLVKFTLLYVD